MADCTTSCTPVVVTETVVQPVETTQKVVRLATQSSTRTVVRDGATPLQVRVSVPVVTNRTDTTTQRAVQVIGAPGPEGPEGPQGPPGPAGGSSIEVEAGETIFGLRAVRAVDGLIYHPDTADDDHAEQVVGIALQSGTGTLLVQVSGQLTEGSWTWTPGLVYCGDDGVLTQSPAATGWLLAVGRAIAADTINIDIDTAFFRG